MQAKTNIFLRLVVMAGVLALAFFPASRARGSVCSDGVGEPPFLSYGVTPNLLLMLDNSGSMYDLAYVKSGATCYDDTYSSASSYAGYFDPATWYNYDLLDQRFEAQASAAVAKGICSAAAGSKFNNAAVSDSLCATINETVTPKVVTAFSANGNFLNWLAASKFDIQKKILTGGKYDAGNNRLTMEARGCGGSRFVKKIGVKDAAGADKFLTLAVKPTSAADPTTKIEIFQVTAVGFNNDACQAALTEMASANPTLGIIKGDIDDCMQYAPNQSYSSASQPAFNQSIQTCWFADKHNWTAADWAGNVNGNNSLQTQCSHMYTDPTPDLSPAAIPADDPGYVCYGVYGAAHPGDGYLGRCWSPGTVSNCTWQGTIRHCTVGVDPANGALRCGADGIWEQCSATYNVPHNTCKSGGAAAPWVDVSDYAWRDAAGNLCAAPVADTPPGWVSDVCVNNALKDFCGVVQVPQVIDPTDLETSTQEVWNIPSMLVDSGVQGQLDDPLLAMKGYIYTAAAPTGLIQQYATEMRLGAMQFNTDGAESEGAAMVQTFINYSAPAANRDGGKVISELGLGAAHTTSLVTAINNISADTWTPLAEAMYNALGYYGQKADRRLDPDDFTVATDPIQYSCQANNILLITEGASTADYNLTVKALADTYHDATYVDPGACGVLSGSTLFDDLTWFGQHGTAATLFATPQLDGSNKQNIKTYIVVAGTPRHIDNTECSPDKLVTDGATNGGTVPFIASDPAALQASLTQVFNEVRAGAASGSAASVISSSRGGEGAVYQAIFWPALLPPSGVGAAVPWAGEIHGLFVDSLGYLHEDTDGDRALSAADQRVIVYYDTAAGLSKACYTTLAADGSCPVASQKDLSLVRFIWSANNWLAKISLSAAYTPYSANDVFLNRATYISNERRRYIFTWEDLNNDGISDSGEILPFVDRNAAGVATDWLGLAVSGGRSSVPTDLDLASNSEVNKLVRWLRGYDPVAAPDLGTQRSRSIAYDIDYNGSNENITWRLGDVIDSTPMAVGAPLEGYHQLYRDSTYGTYVNHWKQRRQVIYFGGNDGMLHAVNGGFYNIAEKKFALTAALSANGESDESGIGAGAGVPELGAELWAYVPYNLLPHLKCLPGTSYDQNHKYYVDQRPRVFDARIFPEEDACNDATRGVAGSGCLHPYGWGTILVGAMRFGGAPEAANTLTGAIVGDTRKFTSAYFVLDITNPEAPPVLLGEMTMRTGVETDMGFTTAIPTIVVMTDSAEVSTWYLVLGSGPRGADAMEGVSDQAARLGILPLSWLTGNTMARKPFRLPAALPSAATSQGGTIVLQNSPQGFVSDLITVDFMDVETNKNFYKSDAVYFGTVEGTAAPWSGKLYRMVTREIFGGNQLSTVPQNWAADWPTSTIGSTTGYRPFFVAGQPIVAAPSVGSDGDNFWVYFGTGRFFDVADKNDNSVQSFYGIKEPRNCAETLTWEQVQKDYSAPISGQLGLLQADQVSVDSDTTAAAGLGCLNAGGCLPPSVTTFAAYQNYVTGAGCSGALATGTDGWYRNFPEAGERNLGQATLLGGLLTFTTYQPFTSPCQAEGVSSLYGIYYQTGTSYYKSVFGAEGLSAGKVRPSISLGRGMTTTPNLQVGADMDAPKAFVQTSTGEIREIQQTDMPISNFKTGKSSWKPISP